MRTLVVGGAGYVGSHTCKALAAHGHEPIVFDNLSSGHADAVKWGPLEQGDIHDSDRLAAVIDKYQPEIIMHFAAFAYVGESIREPGRYYSNNISGSINLLETMRRKGVERIVFSSTCATYGTPDKLPISESTTQSPINPYGFSKLVIEQALADYERAYGLKWVALRYFNAAGCDPDGELGERHDPETHAIPLAISAGLGTGEQFQVFGTDYDTPDGSAVRDYVHVSDLADAHVKAVNYLQNDKNSGAFNLATGHGTSVLEMLAAVERALGRAVPVVLSKRRPGDPPMLYASATQAGQELGWSARFTNIDEIVETAAQWYIHEHNIKDRF